MLIEESKDNISSSDRDYTFEETPKFAVSPNLTPRNKHIEIYNKQS